MIYLEKGFTNPNNIQIIDTDNAFKWLTDYLVGKHDDLELKSQYFTNEQLTNGGYNTIKATQARSFIAGKLKGSRSKENVLERHLLTLDFDNIPNEQSFLTQVVRNLNGIEYMLYPTIRYKLEDNGARFRIVINIDRPITNENEYKIIMENVANDLIGFPADESVANDWQKPSILPIKTDNIPDEYYGFPEGKLLHVDDYTYTTQKPITASYTGIKSNGKGRVVSQIERAMEGINEGNRNECYTSIIGTLLTAKMKPQLAYELVRWLDSQYNSPPLNEELDIIFNSVMRAEIKRNGGE